MATEEIAAGPGVPSDQVEGELCFPETVVVISTEKRLISPPASEWMQRLRGDNTFTGPTSAMSKEALCGNLSGRPIPLPHELCSAGIGYRPDGARPIPIPRDYFEGQMFSDTANRLLLLTPTVVDRYLTMDDRGYLQTLPSTPLYDPHSEETFLLATDGTRQIVDHDGNGLLPPPLPALTDESGAPVSGKQSSPSTWSGLRPEPVPHELRSAGTWSGLRPEPVVALPPQGELPSLPLEVGPTDESADSSAITRPVLKPSQMTRLTRQTDAMAQIRPRPPAVVFPMNFNALCLRPEDLALTERNVPALERYMLHNRYGLELVDPFSIEAGIIGVNQTTIVAIGKPTSHGQPGQLEAIISDPRFGRYPSADRPIRYNASEFDFPAPRPTSSPPPSPKTVLETTVKHERNSAHPRQFPIRGILS